LFSATNEQLSWTAARLRAAGLRYFLGVHCTGIEAVFRIRQLAGLDRRTAAVGAVGASFNLASGVDARQLAR
jgi:7,8-dihydropterin-6-yl-methyl-4-(beta-D-ribofuranosyl)aminobenzene 5'-phosphate synthase